MAKIRHMEQAENAAWHRFAVEIPGESFAAVVEFKPSTNQIMCLDYNRWNGCKHTEALRQYFAKDPSA
jgi:hypothetical protein